MRRIIECLLEEGILEEDIHRILDLIEEEYEVVDENIKDYSKQKLHKTMDAYFAEKNPIKIDALGDQWTKDSDLADKAEKMYNKSREEAGTHELTKNDSGRIHTDIRRGDKLQGTWARRREDEKAGYPKAIKKSIKRHFFKK